MPAGATARSMRLLYRPTFAPKETQPAAKTMSDTVCLKKYSRTFRQTG